MLDGASLGSELNFTLTTTAGDLDLLGEVPSVGTYEDATRDAVGIEVFGRSVHILSLDALERSKRAAGRVKALLDLAEIAEIRKAPGESCRDAPLGSGAPRRRGAHRSKPHPEMLLA